MKQSRFILFVIFPFLFLVANAQNVVVPCFKGAIKAKRMDARWEIVNNIITKNLSLPLTDSTEENWQDAFGAMEVMQYKTPWINSCVLHAFDSVEKRSVDFQHALLELCYANYPWEFDSAIYQINLKTSDDKIYALSTEYLLQSGFFNPKTKKDVLDIYSPRWPINDKMSHQVFLRLADHAHLIKENNKDVTVIPSILKKNFLLKNVVVFSIQRKNRDYPGIVIVKDASGNFVKNNDGSIFSVAQLARSISNLPFYLTNGNTPQGIYRMHGFAVSRADFIGPTENIQLTMPFETSIQYFLKDSTITDTTWTESLYKKLLPDALKDYLPLYESYYASEAGRTEVIAHGTTIDQDYYKDKPYYPQTPTMGCLCTEEVWSPIDGKRIISDQQELVNAVKKAGGAEGYYIVIEIDDAQKPVTLQEILPFIK
jgi:hypothetical protein